MPPVKWRLAANMNIFSVIFWTKITIFCRKEICHLLNSLELSLHGRPRCFCRCLKFDCNLYHEIGTPWVALYFIAVPVACASSDLYLYILVLPPIVVLDWKCRMQPNAAGRSKIRQQCKEGNSAMNAVQWKVQPSIVKRCKTRQCNAGRVYKALQKRRQVQTLRQVCGDFASFKPAYPCFCCWEVSKDFNERGELNSGI